MTGMEMMMKSMGFDPEKIKAEFQSIQATAIESLRNVSAKLDSIDARLLRIEIKLETLPDSEALKLLAENNVSIVNQVKEIYGNNGDGSNHN